MPAKWWTDEKLEMLKCLANKGLSAAQIADYLGKSVCAVTAKASICKIPLGRVFVPSHVKNDSMSLRLYVWENKVLPVVDVTDNGCMLWNGSNYRGYGRISAGGINFRLHRLSLEIKLGRVLSEGEHACHHCDNPSCVNPDHIFLGNHESNMADKAAKGRSYRPSGNKSHLSKLSDELVLSIRSEFDGKRGSVSKLSIKHQMSKSAIRSIINHETWKHI